MTWLTIVHSWPEESREALLDYCRKAEARDPSFKMTVEEDRIVIESPTKDIAHRRGYLLYKRYGCFYEVVKKRLEKR
jgi:hypothetical protein